MLDPPLRTNIAWTNETLLCAEKTILLHMQCARTLVIFQKSLRNKLQCWREQKEALQDELQCWRELQDRIHKDVLAPGTVYKLINRDSNIEAPTMPLSNPHTALGSTPLVSPKEVPVVRLRCNTPHCDALENSTDLHCSLPERCRDEHHCQVAMKTMHKDRTGLLYSTPSQVAKTRSPSCAEPALCTPREHVVLWNDFSMFAVANAKQWEFQYWVCTSGFLRWKSEHVPVLYAQTATAARE